MNTDAPDNLRHQQKKQSDSPNTTVIVTGGSSGIGLAVCNRLAQKGYTVFNLDLKSPLAGEDSESAFRKTPNIQHIACDVRQHAAVVDTIASIAQENEYYKSKWALVCNAGAHLSANIEQTSEEMLTSLFDLNVKGAFSATRGVLPYMKEQGGSIVYISSDQAVIAKSNSFAYNLTKHALASMAKTTAIDYAKNNIRANAVCPGTIDTPLYQKAISAYCERSGEDEASVHKDEANMQPLGRIGKPEEVAAMVEYLLSDDASFITGSLQMIDGGYCAR